jgi:hypothetical protein
MLRLPQYRERVSLSPLCPYPMSDRSILSLYGGEMSDVVGGLLCWLRCVEVKYAPVAYRVSTATQSAPLPVLS